MSQYFSFQWHITDECDQRCKHCYIFSGEDCKELNLLRKVNNYFYLFYFLSQNIFAYHK